MKSVQKIQSILIIGGGLGGLALAQGLIAAGWFYVCRGRPSKQTLLLEFASQSVRRLGNTKLLSYNFES